MVGNKETNTGKGQAMIEFALIILVLLFLIFVVIEGARIFQANLTAQSAARAGGRYAITGQSEPDCLAASPPCSDPRVHSIKQVVLEELRGLRLNPNAAYEEENYYLIEVIGTDENNNQIPDYAGAPGKPVMVRVTYRVGMVTPLTRPIAETVRVIGQVVMVNEQFTQIRNIGVENGPPQLTPYPTPGASPTTSPPDLEVSKTDSVDPVVDGDSFSYTINVINLGDAVASNVTLVDTLPANINYDTANGPANCSASGRDVTCLLGDIDGDGSATVTIPVVANFGFTRSEEQTTVNNQVRAEVDGEANPDNNTATHDTTIVGPPTEADIAISKGASVSLVAVGDEFVYSLGVVNNGLAEATNVTITDNLPGGIAFVSADAGCSHSAGTVTCNLGNIPRNATTNVNVRVRATQEGTFTNTASVSASETDPNPGNNQASSTVQVQNQADLGVTKSFSVNPGVGQQMTYNVSVFNNGPAAATNVQVVDSLPASVNYVSATPSQGSCGQSGNVVTCNLGTIADEAGATVNIVVVPQQEGTITNQVTVSGNETDPYQPNNSFTIDAFVQPRADLEIQKTGPATAVAGETFKYTLTIINHGPSTATGVMVNDNLPADAFYIESDASQGTCSGGSSVSCGLGNMSPGATATVEIWVIASGDGVMVNVATVTSSTIDPDESNNTARTSTDVDGTRPYILLDPICGDPGETVIVRGFNWQDSAPYRDIVISWEDGTELATVPRATNWQTTITIPANATEAVHRIQAQQRTGSGGITVQADFEVPCPAPDLIISDPVLLSPAQPVAGEPIVFSAEVSNIGDLDAVNQFFASLYFDPAPAPAAGDTHIDQAFRVAIIAVNDLAAGATKTVTFTVEADFSVEGTHNAYTVADSDPAPYGVIDSEYDETNNISGPVQVTVRPGASPTPTPTATAGPSPTPGPTEVPGGLIVTVYNQDGQPQSNALVEVIDETDGTVVASGFTDIDGTYYFSSLPPDTYTVTTCVTIESVDYSDFATGIVVSSGNITEIVLFLEESPGACS